MGELLTGRTKWFNVDRGFGYITRDDGGGDVFVHYSDIQGDGFRLLVEGQRVAFGVVDDRHGVHATNVVVIDDAPDTPSGTSVVLALLQKAVRILKREEIGRQGTERRVSE